MKRGIIIGLSLIMLLLTSCKQKNNIEYQDGLDYLKEHNLSLLMAYNGLYRLNIENGNWDKIQEDIQGHIPQEVVIVKDYIYFYDLEDNTIKRIDYLKSSDVEGVLNIDFIPGILSASTDQKNIACSSGNDLYIFSESSVLNTIKFPEIIRSIAWSSDNNLFVSSNNEISMVNIETGVNTKISNGTWIYVLPENQIGYFDIERSACYRKSLISKEEELVQKMNQGVVGMDWSNNGKHIIASKRQKNGLFRWKVELELYDLENQKKYILPQFITYTGCVFLTAN